MKVSLATPGFNADKMPTVAHPLKIESLNAVDPFVVSSSQKKTNKKNKTQVGGVLID